MPSASNFLATTGAVAPFVGLFGTVWGIMNSFFQIGQQQNSSLAVVAPGISEALFATAIGLFAAIPAVIAYNRFSHQVNALESAAQPLRRPPARRVQPRAGDEPRWRWASSLARAAATRPRRAPMAEINVTPLVDVMLVLLIIFMVTAPLLAVGRAGRLAREPRQAALDQDPTRSPSRSTRTAFIFLDDEPVERGRASPTQLRDRRLPSPTKPPLITVRADRALDYGRVMAVMGELNRAGCNRISLVTNSSRQPAIAQG